MTESDQSILRDIAISQAPREFDDEGEMGFEDVVNGNEPLMISNAGGEMEALADQSGASGPIYQMVAGFYQL